METLLEVSRSYPILGMERIHLGQEHVPVLRFMLMENFQTGHQLFLPVAYNPALTEGVISEINILRLYRLLFVGRCADTVNFLLEIV
jgi:hypothetical protein